MNESTPSFRGRLAVKAEKFEGHAEATKALVPLHGDFDRLNQRSK